MRISENPCNPTYGKVRTMDNSFDCVRYYFSVRWSELGTILTRTWYYTTFDDTAECVRCHDNLHKGYGGI